MQNNKFNLTSPDIQEGHFMAKTFEFNGFGCDGPNLSPALHWQNAPEGTQSFAITVYDPDAPTGSCVFRFVRTAVPVSSGHLIFSS